MSEKPSYYAIIPANVRYDNDLKPMEKIIYAEITALANTKGYCYASNSYFSKLYGVHKNTVGNWINNLVNKKLLYSELIYEEKEIIERRLYLDETLIPINEKIDTPINEKIDTPINEKVEDNNTSINITSNNSVSISEHAEQLWKQYPLKKGKARAINKIPQLITKYGFYQIQRCIQRYIKYVEHRRNTDFKDLKYQDGSTFFNGTYMDYLDENYTDNKETNETTNETNNFDFSFWNK